MTMLTLYRPPLLLVHVWGSENGGKMAEKKTVGKWQECNLVSGMASVASNMGWL